jgi:hypothetical protein
MWILVFLLNLLGPKNFLRFAIAWLLIMAFFLYCFVHEGFDTPRPVQQVPAMQRNAETLTAKFERSQRLLNRPLDVLGLASLVSFVREITRPDGRLHVGCGRSM